MQSKTSLLKKWDTKTRSLKSHARFLFTPFSVFQKREENLAPAAYLSRVVRWEIDISAFQKNLVPVAYLSHVVMWETIFCFNKQTK